MNRNLAGALSLLGINELVITETGALKRLSPLEHANALFEYFELAGFLSDASLEKAVDYLSADQAFQVEATAVLEQLKGACRAARSAGDFNTKLFFTEFAKEPFFRTEDVIDLIVFLQQTAFDRQFGVERDRLTAKPWMLEHATKFFHLATHLGLTSEHRPQHKDYQGIGIMGAASFRVRARLEYFNHLGIACNELWALSGKRELSKGLDEEEVMLELASTLGIPANFIEKPAGTDTRVFLDGITETQMVNFFIAKLCPEKRIAILDSAIAEGHWRATTSQNATDIASIIIKRLMTGEIEMPKDGIFRFMIIAEQPHTDRMARDVQRAFNTEAAKQGCKICVEIEGCGSGINLEDASNQKILANLNSSLGSLMSERFRDARLHLTTRPSMKPRDPKILLFMERDRYFAELKADQASTIQRRLG